MPELLTIQEIADKLKVPISWIYARTRKRSNDNIPHIRIGKYLRFEEAEVTTWLQSQREGYSGTSR
jgi:excisionase family DNA binding protein